MVAMGIQMTRGWKTDSSTTVSVSPWGTGGHLRDVVACLVGLVVWIPLVAHCLGVGPWFSRAPGSHIQACAITRDNLVC